MIYSCVVIIAERVRMELYVWECFVRFFQKGFIHLTESSKFSCNRTFSYLTCHQLIILLL